MSAEVRLSSEEENAEEGSGDGQAQGADVVGSEGTEGEGGADSTLDSDGRCTALVRQR